MNGDTDRVESLAGGGEFYPGDLHFIGFPAGDFHRSVQVFEVEMSTGLEVVSILKIGLIAVERPKIDTDTAGEQEQRRECERQSHVYGMFGPGSGSAI